MADTTNKAQTELETALAALQRDYAKMGVRIRTLSHSVACKADSVTLRLHFPAFRQGRPTVYELVNAISEHLVHFALPRRKFTELYANYARIPPDDFLDEYTKLRDEAFRVFMLAQKNTQRNGEAGELLLYLFTEWILQAPQILAKMSLKTNRSMSVYGADGVHARFSPETQQLLLYWGEAKLHTDVSTAITSALTSIVEALSPEKMQLEIDLVERNIDFSSLSASARNAFLQYLDPYEECYNARHDITTCLIGFDFAGFQAVTGTADHQVEEHFAELARKRLESLAPQVAEKLAAHGLQGHPIELFFFPVPSIDDFRELFQDKIGWKK